MQGDYRELTVLSFEDVESYLKPILIGYGYSNHNMPTIDPGPVTEAALKKSPNAMVFLVVGGGPGLSREGAFDGVFITVRIVGNQRDYEHARRLAYAVDRAFLAFSESGDLGSIYCLGITRSGGPPQALLQDTAERYHFTGSYVTEVDAGL